MYHLLVNFCISLVLDLPLGYLPTENSKQEFPVKYESKTNRITLLDDSTCIYETNGYRTNQSGLCCFEVQKKYPYHVNADTLIIIFTCDPPIPGNIYHPGKLKLIRAKHGYYTYANKKKRVYYRKSN